MVKIFWFLLVWLRFESSGIGLATCLSGMYKGIYIALSGAVLKQREMDVLSQNLANADTIGYKKDTVSFRDYLMQGGSEDAAQDARVMSAVSSLSTDFSSGNMAQTGSALDIAIEGDGFIALEGNRFTRRGDLRRDKDGYLTAYNGVKVLGNGGPIQLPEGEIVISETGDISVEGTQVDKFMIKDFPDPAELTKVGGGMFLATGSGVDSSSKMRQGAIEKSNVEVITEMVRMIQTVREFETYQKAIQAFDEATSKVNNEIGRI